MARAPINGITTPEKHKTTDINFDRVSLSPEPEGNTAAKINVKKLDTELNSVTIAASLGSKANWNK